MRHETIREDGLEIEVTRLANGLTVLTEAMPHIATATLGIWVGAGSRNERAEEHGLSHLIEHMAFKGTASRSARRIAEEIENVGGDINAATTAEYTCYTAKLLGEDIGVALAVLGDILTESAFEEAELAREKGVILQELSSIEDTPDDLVFDAFMETAFADQPIGRPIIGRRETIAAFDPATIRAFMAREYAPSRMVLAAAGLVRHEEIVAAAEACFGSLRDAAPSEAPAATYTGGEWRVNRRLEQANLVIGLPGVSFRDPTNHATQIFAQTLGGGLTSRLWQEVRETRGLAYEIGAFHWPFSDCGLFGINAATSAADLGALVELALATFREAARGVTPEELERAKTQMKVGLLSALESPGGRTERMARQWLAFGRILTGAEIVAKVEAVTRDDVAAAAAALLAGPPTVAAIGPIRGLPKRGSLAKAVSTS